MAEHLVEVCKRLVKDLHTLDADVQVKFDVALGADDANGERPRGRGFCCCDVRGIEAPSFERSSDDVGFLPSVYCGNHIGFGYTSSMRSLPGAA